MRESAEKAETLSGYDTIDKLRQRQDSADLLAWAYPTTTSMLDLGCGTGSLLAAAAERLSWLRTVTGLDRLPDRLVQAEEKLRGIPVAAHLIEADLADPPELDTTFDLITMTAVLHWLHPHEDAALRWVERHLGAGGTALLTTYHPSGEVAGLGGTDAVVVDALALLGLDRDDLDRDDMVQRFADAGLTPLTTRTRDTDTLAELLQEHFTINAVHRHEAVMRVTSGIQYQDYHAATFGTYYAPLAAPHPPRDFFDALGRAAERRMIERGNVTAMSVRQWRVGPR